MTSFFATMKTKLKPNVQSKYVRGLCRALCVQCSLSGECNCHKFERKFVQCMQAWKDKRNLFGSEKVSKSIPELQSRMEIELVLASSLVSAVYSSWPVSRCITT